MNKCFQYDRFCLYKSLSDCGRRIIQEKNKNARAMLYLARKILEYMKTKDDVRDESLTLCKEIENPRN